MSEKERTMSGTTESHMFLHKAGGFLKDKEQLVICKLASPGIGERPEIQIFTDGSEKTNSIVKVKSFAVVQKGDIVPKIVKEKYDNYICITGSGSGTKPTYLRTDTREQRDEWCIQLRALMPNRTTSNSQLTSQQPSQPYRERTHTDASSNKPPVSRTRKGAHITAPGSMQGIFHDELDKVFQKRINPPQPTEETDDSPVCGRPHLEAGASHDARCQDTDENVHHADDCPIHQQTSRQALQKTQELYQDFHHTKTLQENEYEIPEFRRDPLPESDNRLSGCRTSSEESKGGALKSLHICKVPTESSWPPSPAASDESEPECSEINPPCSKTFTGEMPGGRLLDVKEPEAGLCLDEHIYENTSVIQRRPRTDSRTPPRSASVRNDAKPHLPPRKSSVSSLTAKPVPLKPQEKTPAMKIVTKCRKLKGEKLSGTAAVHIAKTTLVRYLSQLLLKETSDSILVMDVPRELKDYFRVGDQWLKVNDTMLKNVRFARDCVRMSDKLEIEITLRRIPFGTICDFQWNSDNVDDIGLKLQGNEIERVSQEGLAHRRGSLQSNDTTCLNCAGLRCNYVITEVNFECVHPDASTEQVWEMIEKAGRIVILILHPSDFRTVQKEIITTTNLVYGKLYDVGSVYEGISERFNPLSARLHTRASGSSSSSPEPESIALPTSDDRSLQSWKVTEETTLPCSSPSLPDGTEPEFPDKLSSSFKEDMPDGYFCEGGFDSKGGVMTVSSHTMTIPPGALDTQTPVKITMKVLRDVPSDILLQDDETVVTYGFWCLPSGLRFAADKPVTLTIPHCAKLIDPHSIQTVLYSWSHNEKEGDETVKPERIVQTPRTCRVTPHNIEISLEHFSGGFLAFLRSWFYMDGKVMSFMPFLPKMMPISRKLMMELRMVNKPHGTSWKDLHALDKTARYQPAKDDDDEMVVEDEDLQVSLKLEDNIPINKDVKSELLNRTTKHTEYFDLDLNDKPDDSLVILKLKQSTLEMDIQFRTQFSEECDHSASESAVPHQISTIGSLDTTTSYSVDEASENLNEIMDLDVAKLAQQLGNHDDVEMVALNLGFSHARWQQFSDMNRDGRLTGTRNMLFDWKKDTPRELQRPSLKKVLENSNYLELADTI